MKINPMGLELWLKLFQAAITAITGLSVDPPTMRRMSEDLTEEWFQGTPPREAAPLYLARIARECLTRQAA